MAGNTVSIRLGLQPAESTNIDAITVSVEVKQPTAGATTNPQARMKIQVYPREPYTTSNIQVMAQMGVYGDADHGTLRMNTGSQSSYYDSGWGSWTNFQTTHTKGTDRWNFQVSCTGASRSGTQDGKIYWEEPTPTPTPTTLYIYYQNDGAVISSYTQTVTKGNSVTLRQCNITKSGYTFNGWVNRSKTYAPGYTFTPTETLYFSASWVESGGGTTSSSIVIKAANSDDKIYASTSGIMGTAAANNGTNQVTISCSGKSPTKVEILPDASGNKLNNSFAILVTWGSETPQEVVFGCSDTSVNGANWITSKGVTLTSTTDDTNPASITVSRYNTTGTRGNTVTKVTLNDYWIANTGYSNGTVDRTVGSSNNPGIWYWHSTNYGGITTAQLTRKISWTKPVNGDPLYYVIMYWKGYSAGDERSSDKLGQVLVASGSATSITDPGGWFQGLHEGYQIKIVVHAVYAGGPNPTFSSGEENAYSTANTGLGKSAIEDYALWWKWGAPPTLRNIKFYEQNKTTILKDNNNADYDYYAPVGSVIEAPTEIKINGVDQSEAYNLNGWYKKEGSGSWGTSVLTNLGTVGSSDLSFAQKITKRTYKVNYNSTATALSYKTFEHGDVIKINNANGSSVISRTIKAPYDIPVPVRTDYTFTGFSYDSSTKTFTAQWVQNQKKIWIKIDATTWQQGIPWIKTESGWVKGKSAFIKDSSWKEEK